MFTQPPLQFLCVHTTSVAVCFKVFDMDHDGRLSQEELERMLEAMLLVRQENTPPHKLVGTDHNKNTPPHKLVGTDHN